MFIPVIGTGRDNGGERRLQIACSGNIFQRDRSFRFLPARLRQRGLRIESTPSKDFGLSASSG